LFSLVAIRPRSGLVGASKISRTSLTLSGADPTLFSRAPLDPQDEEQPNTSDQHEHE
jgi:hypothetical protein